MKEGLTSKLHQAQEALEEARALLAAGAEMNFVMNSLYYALLYPVLGLLRTRNISPPMQSTAIELFEREFVATGEIDPLFVKAVRRAFELRPSCECEAQKRVTKEDIDHLMPLAKAFLEQARHMTE